MKKSGRALKMKKEALINKNFRCSSFKNADLPKPGSSPGTHLWLLLVLTGIFFFNFIARIIPAPLMPMIETELGITHAQAGSIFLILSAGYFVSLISSGFIASRIFHKTAIVLSSLVLGVAVLATAMSGNLTGFRLGMLIMGAAAGLYLPSAIATLTDRIDSRNWGKAIAVHELAPNLAFVAAPLGAEMLLEFFSWRGVMKLVAACAIVLGMCFARWGKGGQFSGQKPDVKSFQSLFGKPSFWLMTALFSLGICSTLGLYTMLPLYLVTEHGISRPWANSLLTLSRISTIGMVFLGGWAADRFSARQTMGGILLITGMLTVMIGMTSGAWMIVAVFLQPMLAVCFFPAGFAALSMIGPPQFRNIAISLSIPGAFLIGGGAIPAGMGMMADAGHFSAAVVLTGLLIGGGSLLTLLLESSQNSPNLK